MLSEEVEERHQDPKQQIDLILERIAAEGGPEMKDDFKLVHGSGNDFRDFGRENAGLPASAMPIIRASAAPISAGSPSTVS